MELPPLTQHHLKRLLADGRWQKLRFHLGWGTALFCALLLWLFSKAPFFNSSPFFSSLLLGIPTLVVSTYLVMTLIDELPRARRDNMLELLALAGINPLGIWIRKAALTLFLALTCLSCLVPLFLLLAVQEHVHFTTLILHAILVLLLLLYLLGVTLLATISSADTGRSLAGFVAIIFFSSLLLPAWAVGLEKLLHTSWLGEHWFLIGPVNGYIRCLNNLKLLHGHFPLIAGGLLFWTVLFFFLAFRFFDFRTNFGQASVPTAQKRWLTLWLPKLTGSDDPATSSNPLARLLHRERLNVLYAWCISLAILASTLFILLRLGSTWFNPFDLIFVAFVLVGVLSMYTSNSVQRLMADARREGLLELVLTSGLTPKEFVDGIESGITRFYQRLFWLQIAALSLLAVWGSTMRPFNVQATISYCLIWAWICYFAYIGCFQRKSRSLWIALNLGRPAYSVAQLWLPAFFTTLYHSASMILSRKNSAYHLFSQFPWGNGLELTVIILISIIGLVLSAASFDDFTEETLLKNFREVATSPLPDPSDERIAKWDRAKVFPTQRNT